MEYGMEYKRQLKPNWHETFSKYRETLFSELYFLNKNIYLLDNLDRIPAKSDTIHWLKINVCYCTVELIWKLAVDTNKDILSLNKFKTEIFQNLVDDTAESRLKDELKKGDFVKRTAEYIEELKICDIRHKYTAHYNKVSATDWPNNLFYELRQGLPKLQPLVNEMNRYFVTLCFGSIKVDNLKHQENILLDKLNKDSRVI